MKRQQIKRLVASGLGLIASLLVLSGFVFRNLLPFFILIAVVLYIPFWIMNLNLLADHYAGDQRTILSRKRIMYALFILFFVACLFAGAIVFDIAELNYAPSPLHLIVLIVTVLLGCIVVAVVIRVGLLRKR